MKKHRSRRYKVNIKLLANAVFNANKIKYLATYSSTTKAKKEIKEIIDNTFKEITNNILEDRVVEIWGFAKFSLKSHKRFLTKFVQCTFGNTIKLRLKTNQKEYLKQEILELMYEIKELEVDNKLEEDEILKEKLKDKKIYLKKLKNALDFKSVSLNPKYRDNKNEA